MYFFTVIISTSVCLKTFTVSQVTAVSWLFLIEKQKSNSKVVKLEEFFKKCSEVKSKAWVLLIADKDFPIENNGRNERVVPHFSRETRKKQCAQIFGMTPCFKFLTALFTACRDNNPSAM